MNKISIILLKSLRKIYGIFYKPRLILLQSEQNPDIASKIIYNHLTNSNPCMIARFGSTEMLTMCNYLGVHKQGKNILGYIKNNTFSWWWEENTLNQIKQWSGFFPSKVNKVEQFCELMFEDIKQLDVLGSWLANETYFDNELKNKKKIRLLLFDPFWANTPWTLALKEKKILVVHPFAETIELQYKKRKFLFKNNLLPDFELKTIKAVQSIAGAKTQFKDWFEALEYMKNEIDKIDYDICLIGAGAYGFPLAAHVKRMGKKAFHIGGSLQLLFGIRGKRWESNYNSDFDYASLVNKYWVKPQKNETPVGAVKVENACYW